MRQRVAFLRTLLAGRPLLLLDEPFGALDSITRADLQEWLAGALAEEPRTVLLVTHDVEEAVFLADRVIVLSAAAGPHGAEFEVALPRPRSVTRPELAQLQARSRWRRCVMRPVLSGALLVLFVLAWQGVASLHWVDDLTLASPVETCGRAAHDRALLLDNALVTLVEVLLGLAIAVVAGVGLAIGMHLIRPLRDAAYPLLVASQAIPMVVLAPISCSRSTTASAPSSPSWP